MLKYFHQFAIILLYVFIGEILAFLIPLPIPAVIYGIVLLFLSLHFGLIKVEKIKESSHFLVQILPFLFVAPMVGIVKNLDSIYENIVGISILVVVSTIVTFIVTGLISKVFQKK